MIKAKYTVVLKSLMDDPDTFALIQKAMESYPLYEKRSKEEFIPSIVPTRSELNEKILNYYKYREIGFETVGRFIDELEIALKEIMPYYNQLLFTLDQDYNILYNVDYDKTITSKRDTSSDSETETNGSDTSTGNVAMNDKSKTVHSATPQGQLNIPKNNIDSVQYADSAQWEDKGSESETNTTGTTNANTTGKSSGTESAEMAERVKGNYGQMSYQYLVAKYRELIMNIEQRIIQDHRIQELFMLVY